MSISQKSTRLKLRIITLSAILYAVFKVLLRPWLAFHTCIGRVEPAIEWGRPCFLGARFGVAANRALLRIATRVL